MAIATSASRSMNALMMVQSSLMTNARRSPTPQRAALTPDDRTVLRLVRENLRLISELRVSYRAASRGTDARHIRSAEDVANLLSCEMAPLVQEQLRTVLLDARNRVMDVVLVYQGNVSMVVTRMGELFRDAVIANASNVILVHNHPSGDASASPDDVSLTKQAAEAGRLLGIDVLDHIVIGHEGFVSLKERGLM
jgi:DNA repair protein RadC